MIWIIFALMTAAVLTGLLWPVMRPAAPMAPRSAHDRAVFRDQLAELERDLLRGAIGEREAEAARNEIARRIIAADAAQAATPVRIAPAVVLAAALVVPAVALPLYLHAGNPGLPDVPLAARLANAEKTGDFEALIARIERHLADNPSDLKGWQVLAPVYQRSQRHADAARALEAILRLAPPTAVTLADYGEALTSANQGVVTAAARRALRDALTLDRTLPKARYLDALALKQEGKASEARAAFQAFLADSPSDAPWRANVEAEIADLESRPPPLAPDAVEQAGAMTPGEQQEMIRTMVDGLDARLKADGSDLNGWLKLIRARKVLQEDDKATSAYATAKQLFKNSPDALAALDALAKELNVR